METVMTMFRPLSTAIDARLGRCSACMQWSAVLTAGSVLVLALLIGAGASTAVMLTAGVPAIAFTALSVAHGVAYVVRGPAPAAGCASCAEKARARRLARLRSHPWSFLRRQKVAITKAPATGCRTCGKSRGDLPADEGMRAIVEASPEFQSLVGRLAEAEPVDSWEVDMRNHFLYRLKPETDGEGARALFVARWEDDDLLSALVITPDPAGGEPMVVDYRAAGPDRTS